MARNIIDEYLVSLGVDIDHSSISKLDNALGKIEGMVNATASLGKNLAVASTAIIGSIFGIISAGTALVTSNANVENSYATLSASMMITERQAKSMKMALDALGKSQNEVMLNPKLREQYRALLADNQAMSVGGDYKAMMNEVTDFMFEFTRLKQEIAVGMQWIAYYIVKDLAGPLGEAKDIMKQINNYIIQNMPRITRTIATGFGYVRNIFFAIWRVFKNIALHLKEFWENLPKAGKKAFIALGLALFAASGPVGALIVALGSLLLLLEDYFAYMDGKESMYGKYWEKLNEALDSVNGAWDSMLKYVREFFDWIENSDKIKRFTDLITRLATGIAWLASELGKLIFNFLTKFYDTLSDTGTLDEFTGSLSEITDAVLDLINTLGDLVYEVLSIFFEDMEKTDILQAFCNFLTEIVRIFAMMIRAVASIIKLFTKFLEQLKGDPKIKAFWKSVTTLFDEFFKKLASGLSTLGKIGKIIGLLLTGNFAEAAKLAGQTITGGSGTFTGTGEAGTTALEDVEYLVKNGLSEQLALAIVANHGQESEHDPTNYVANDGDGRPSGGLGMWHADRLEDLKAFAAERGTDWTDRKTQLDYIIAEAKGLRKNYDYSSVAARAAAAGSVEEATQIWTDGYEVPDPQYANYARRQADATALKSVWQSKKDTKTAMGDGSFGGVIMGHAQLAKEKFNNWIGNTSSLSGASSFASPQPVVFNGGINVNVANSNASAEDIANATSKGIMKALPRRNIDSMYDRGSGVV